MGVEIERKFLITSDAYQHGAEGQIYRQGYLSNDKNRVVRVRLKGNKGYLTIKGISQGIVRSEYEYEIPHDDAAHLLEVLCLKPIIEKTRYKISYEGHIWEVDEFHGENEGLVVAEIELSHKDEKFSKPLWIGAEVSDDYRYFNSNLTTHPYSLWKKSV